MEHTQAATNLELPASSHRLTNAGDAPPAIPAIMQQAAPKTAQQKTPLVRVRTGCLTCRARRIKCDEARPACRRCFKSGRKCQGYSVAAPSEKDALKFAVAIAPNTRTQDYENALATRCPIERSRVPREVRPPDWDYAESFRYFYSIIQPHRHTNVAPERNLNLPSARTCVRPIFLIFIVAHRILRASKVHGRLLPPGEDAALTTAWESYFCYVLQAIDIVNQCIRGEGPYGSYHTTFNRIVDLVALELKLRGGAWRAHMEGFLVFLAHYGGVEQVLRLQQPPLYQFQFLFAHGLAANSTSPARAQVEGFSKISDRDLRVILGHEMFIDMSCPTDLFIQMVHITRLRVLIENNTLQPAAIQTIADTIFNRIDDFDPDNWTESYKLSDTPVVPSIAHTYKLAVALYGILSLPQPVFICWSAARGNTHSYQHQLVTRRTALLARARTTWALLEHQSALCWPLIVAGVALVHGPADDQDFVASGIRAIWLHPNAYYGPIVCLGKIQALWESGKTGWEDCFDEPAPPLP